MTAVWSCVVVDPQAVSRQCAHQSAPIIFGPVGPELSAEEAAFYRAASPFGFILFQRNCQDKAQLKKLIADLRHCVGWHCPVLIDQEGGRVARMKPPVWRDHPSAGHCGSVIRNDPQNGTGIVQQILTELCTELSDVGIDVNCLPVLDVLQPGVTDNIIGDRAYGDDPEFVAKCGSLACQVLSDCGITAVIKHLPGHGGARVDSHQSLPRVTITQRDLTPFIEVASLHRNAWGMVAHLLIEGVDTNTPSSLSKTAIQQVIRGQIGFDGILLSDDLSMGALDGYGGEAQTAKMGLEAGLDIALHCNGAVDEMRAVMDTLPAMRQDTRERISRWMTPQ